MEYMRPNMVDHDDENSPRPNARPPQEQANAVGGDVSADPAAGVPAQVPPPPAQRGAQEPSDPSDPRGRFEKADTVDQGRAWRNADEGTQQTYTTSDPVD
jgi:hypothetical protein